MYQIVILVIMLIIIALFFLFPNLPQRVQTGMLSTLLFIPILCFPPGIMFMALISFPGLITHLMVSSPLGQKILNNVFGIELSPEETSIRAYFFTRIGFTIGSAMYLLVLLTFQITVLSLLNFNTLTPNIKFGQLLPISIYDLPKVLYLIAAYVALPLFISEKLSTFENKFSDPNTPQSARESYIDAMQTLGTLIGFLLSKVATSIITPLELLIPLVIVLPLFATNGMQKLFNLIGVPLPADVFKISEIFRNGETFFIFMNMYIIFTAIMIIIGPCIPLYSYIYHAFHDEKITKIFIFIIQLLMFWLVPTLLGRSFERSLKRTAGVKNAEKIEKTNGYAMGYVIGVMLMVSVYLYFSRVTKPLQVFANKRIKIATKGANKFIAKATNKISPSNIFKVKNGKKFF